MRLYFDVTSLNGCIGFLNEDGPAILCGTQLHQEPRTSIGELTERLEREKDIVFYYAGDSIPLPFYTVPHCTLLGHDSRGGYFLTTEDALYYADKDGQTYFLAPTLKDWVENPNDWRKTMTPSETPELFPSRAAAQEKYDIQIITKLEDLTL